jgi:hypothetical protein
MPSVLSIDVGSRNLGLCVLGPNTTIEHWQLLELPTPLTPHNMCEAMAKVLDEWTYDTVVIERQPGKNHLMQRIQHYCEMLFHCRGKPVVIMDARAKLLHAAKTVWWPSEIDITKKWSYRTRKTAAVKTVRTFLEATHSPFAQFFNQCPKKDDVADALLQAMTLNNISREYA